MATIDDLASVIETVVDDKISKTQKKTGSVIATVNSKDLDGTVWVTLDGGVEKTPITTVLADVQPGDVVAVRIENGRSYIDGNATSPAASGRSVDGVRETAEKAQETGDAACTLASSALESAAIAKDAADSAIADASIAREAAEDAAEDAASASSSASAAASAASTASAEAAAATTAAAAASEQAISAQGSAQQANEYAVGALMGLSDVEKVVGALNWITEHGSWAPTQDDTVEPGKQYYVLNGGSYSPVQDPTDDCMFSYALTQDVEIDSEKTYYEQVVEYTYAVTQDTEIITGKTYYEQIIIYEYEPTQDVEIDPAKTYYVLVDSEYVVVEDPDVADIGTYYEQLQVVSYDAVAAPDSEDLPTYYERMEHVSYVVVEEPILADLPTYYERTVLYYELTVEESVQNYIATHLSLTEDGLNLTADSNKYRAVLATDGLRILDPQGNVVGVHGEEVQLGSTNGIYFSATSNVLSFRTADQLIAWFGQNADGIWEMHIQNTYAEDMVRFGDYAFIKRANGNMSLKWLGEVSN